MCRTENLYFGTLCKCHPDRRTNCFLSLESSLCPFISSTHQIPAQYSQDSSAPHLCPTPSSGCSWGLFCTKDSSPALWNSLLGSRDNSSQPALRPSASPFLYVPIHFLLEPSRKINPHGLTPIPVSELSLKTAPLRKPRICP